MKKKLAIFFAFLCLCLLLKGESLVIRISDPGVTEYHALLSNGVDIALYYPGAFLDIVISSKDLAVYQDKYPELRITQTEAEMKANLSSGDRDIPGYRTYDEVVLELAQMAATYPSLISMHSIGSGWGKIYADQGIPAYQDYAHEIWAMKLSNNVLEEEDEAQFLFVGAHHAREPLSVETCMAIMYYLLENYGTDPRVTAIMDSSEIWVVPLLNPDGHKLVLDQTQIMWRKNLNDNNGNQQIDWGSNGNGADGADINRNYSYMWGNISATDNPNDSVYHGASPFSEPESAAIRDLVMAKHFLASISYHTYGRYVLYPFGFAHDVSGPDVVEQRLLAQEMALLTGYTAMPSHDLYPVSGSCEDWLLGVRGMFSYTIEMANQFIPQGAQVQQLVQEQIPAALALLERKDYKSLKGNVTDASTGNPMVAQIYIPELDNHVPQRAAEYSRPDFGSYHRFLPEGNHEVIVHAPGYIPQAVDVTISVDGVTVQDFSLQPAEAVSASFLIRNHRGQPLPGALLELDELQFVADSGGMIYPTSLNEGFYQVKASHPGYSSYAAGMILMPGLNVITLSSHADVYDGFEQGADAWQLTGRWGIGSEDAAAGDNWLGDNPLNQSWTQLSYATHNSIFDLDGAQNVRVSFQAKCAMTTYSEYAALQYRDLASTDWHTLMVFMGESPWQAYELDLSFLRGRQISLRFMKNNQYSQYANGFYLDEFCVFSSGDYSSVNELILNLPQISAAPNPFSTDIMLFITNLPKGPVSADVYNIRGQKVKSMQTNHLTNDPCSFSWNGQDHLGRELPAGIYFVRFSRNHNTLVTKKILKL